MPSIDERVVAMSFENSKFEAGVAQTMATLNKLEGSLANVGKTSGLSNIEAEANRISFSGLVSAIDGIASHFTVLQGVVSVALGSIVAKVVEAGAQMTKGLTLGPITEGFHNYETQINAVQTILANTGLTGEAGIGKVNAALQNLNVYANQTIFNFSEMAKNIGTFTAAGVGLNQATESIKGIANLAALSGSNAQQASTAMYQLSQAIAAGAVHLQDWNSVVNAGMGGEVFQKALFNTAKAMHTITDSPVGQTFEEWKKAGNSFRQSLSTTAKQGGKDADVLKKAQIDSAKSIADAQKAAADSIEQSSRRVHDAQQGVSDAAKQGAADIASAVQAQADTIKRSGEDVKNALDGVREARKRLAEAMKPPSKDELQAASDALKTSQLDQADLADAVAQAQQDQTRAAQDLTTAQAKLAAVQKDPKATADQLLAAQRAVEDAQKRVTDTADAQTRALLAQRAATRDVDQAEKDLRTTREKGTKKDKNVKDAQDALTDSINKLKDARKKQDQDITDAAAKVADARQKSAESQVKAGQRLADAEKQQADTIKSSQEKIADAHKAAADKINAARASLDTKAPSSWLTSDVLTTTLRTFTGDMTDAQLKAQGFTDAQIKNIQATAKVAVQSATQIKTFSQLTQALKEEVGSAWANVFKTLFGNIDQARTLFTEFHNFTQAALTGPVIALNKVLEGWAKLGGRVKFIEGLKSGFHDLEAILKPIHDAFIEVFPPATAKSLFDLTVKFKSLMDSLLIGPKTADELRRTFAGFFAVLHIGWTIVKDVAKVIFDLIGVAGQGSGSFLGITASVGDFLVKLDRAISKGKGFQTFLEGLEGILKLPIEALKHLGDLIASLFGADKGPNTKGVSDSMGSLNTALQPLKGTLDVIGSAWDKITGIFDHIVAAIGPTMAGIGSAVASFVQVLTDAVQNSNFDTLFAAIQTTLIGGIFLVIKKALGKGVGVDVGGGLLKNLSGLFKGLTGNLEAMQQNLKANTLLQIAAAIGVLAAGVAVLASIDAKNLNKAMTAVAVGLGELVGAMALLAKVGGGATFIQLPLIAGSLILVATAVTILAGAMKIFATMKWEEILKGLAGVAGSLTAVGVGLALIGPDVIVVGPGLLVVATSLTILAGAMKIFATMKWGEIGKGLVGIAGGLTALAIGLVGIGPEVLLIGPGLILTSIGLVALAGAVKAFGSMSLETIGIGILGIAGALVTIGLAMQTMPATLPLTAAGLVILAPALAGIAGVVAILGNMAISTLAKGIVAMGLALGVLSLGLNSMIATLPGSAALAIAAVGLAGLVPVLGILGNMKWSTILSALGKLAVIMGGLSIAGALAAPGLIILGAALIPLGLGMTLVSGAIYIFAKAIKIMGDEGAKAVGATIVALTALAVAIPKIVIDFLKGLVEIVSSVAKVLPQVVVALGLILDTIIAFVIEASPKLALAVTALITAILDVLNQNAGPIILAGNALLIHFLEGVAQNIPAVITQVAAIGIAILTTLASMAPDLVTAGVTALVSFITGIVNNMPKLVTAVSNMVVAFANAVSTKLPQIVQAGANLMVKFVGAILAAVPTLIAGGVTAVLSFFGGIAKKIPAVVDKGVEVVGKLLEGISKAMVRLVNKGADAVINFLNGIAAAIRTKGPELRAAGWNVASALIDGIWQGIEQLGQKVVDKLGLLIHLLPNAAKKILGIKSPSTVFEEIGRNSMAGMASGIDKGGSLVTKSIVGTTGDIVDTASASLSKVPEFLDKMTDINPVITPVLDLSVVKEQAKDIGPTIGSSAVLDLAPMAKESTKQASALSFETASSDPWGVGTDHPANVIHQPITFNQNNTSPKALTAAEIYRLTHNQLASAKGRLFGKVDNIR